MVTVSSKNPTKPNKLCGQHAGLLNIKVDIYMCTYVTILLWRLMCLKLHFFRSGSYFVHCPGYSTRMFESRARTRFGTSEDDKLCSNTVRLYIQNGNQIPGMEVCELTNMAEIRQCLRYVYGGRMKLRSHLIECMQTKMTTNCIPFLWLILCCNFI
jgi:hypothetical protein